MKIIKAGQHKIIVDDGDFVRLSKYTWNVPVRNGKPRYARTNSKIKENRLLLAHLVIKPTLGMFVDHINRNTLDNRRSNLRIVTRRQNNLNQRLQPDNTSGFRGVTYYKQTKKWFAKISVNSRTISLGYYREAVDAAISYDMAALMFNGEFAQTNILIPLETVKNP